MSIYKVTIESITEIEIDQDNTEVEGPKSLQGDSEIVAVRRAVWSLFQQHIALYNKDIYRETIQVRRKLGVKRILIRGHERDMKVEKVSE